MQSKRPNAAERVCRHRPTCCSESSAGQSLCRADGPGRGVESRRSRGLCQGYHDSTHQPMTEAPDQPIVTATRETARPKTPEPKFTAALCGLLGSLRRKQPRVSKLWPPHPQHPARLSPPKVPPRQISDLLDHLHFYACVELSRLLMSISSLPTGAARPRAVLKTAILLVAENGSTP